MKLTRINKHCRTKKKKQNLSKIIILKVCLVPNTCTTKRPNLLSLPTRMKYSL